jgi:hypothetical protein
MPTKNARIDIMGIGNGDVFGIRASFTNELKMFMPFPCGYLKDLKPSMLVSTIDEMKFYVDQIKLGINDPKEETQDDDLSEI